MRVTLLLAILATVTTAGCLGGGTPEAVAVTAAPAATATPAPTATPDIGATAQAAEPAGPTQTPARERLTIIIPAATAPPDPSEPPGPTATPEPTAVPRPEPARAPESTAAPPLQVSTTSPLLQTSTPTPGPAATPQSTPEGDRATAAPPTRVPGPTMPSTGDPRQDALRAMYELPWMKDGATSQERETADRIEALSRYNGHLSLRVVSMPFLQTHQITDTGAVSALAHISLRDRPAADRIANHPTLSGGIEDKDTVAVALTYGEWLLGSNHHRLMEAGSINWQTYEASLPLSGTVAITIVTAGESTRTRETATLIAQDLAWLETYLDQPLSTHNVLVHYGSGLRPPVKGANVQASIMQPARHHNPSEYHWVQHELAHYWFNSNEGWLDEGIAQVLTSLLNSEGEPASLPATSPSCPESARIRDMETTNPETAVGSRCLYAVGERFMRTLYQEAGYQGFRTGAAKLAARANRPPFRGMGTEEVRTAFGATPEAVQTAEDRWK